MSSASGHSTNTSTASRNITKAPRRGHKTKLSPDFEPTPYTVLCGRGRECYDSVGNRRFRVLVSRNLARYSQARTKAEKTRLVLDVVDAIRAAGGGFVQRTVHGEWYDIGEDAAREKVGAQFRDCLYKQYRSSATQSKAERRVGDECWVDHPHEDERPEPTPMRSVSVSDRMSVASDLSSEGSTFEAANVTESSPFPALDVDSCSASTGILLEAEIVFDPQSFFPF